MHKHQTERGVPGKCVKVSKIARDFTEFLKKKTSFSTEYMSTGTGRKNTTVETTTNKVWPSKL